MGWSGREGVGGEQQVALQCGVVVLSQPGPGSGEVGRKQVSRLDGVSYNFSALVTSFGVCGNGRFSLEPLNFLLKWGRWVFLHSCTDRQLTEVGGTGRITCPVPSGSCPSPESLLTQRPRVTVIVRIKEKLGKGPRPGGVCQGGEESSLQGMRSF